MANINKTNNSKKNTNKSPVGTMPKDQISRFKLHGNFENDRPKVISRNTHRVKQLSRLVSTYRMKVHGVAETKLPSQLKQVVHYFCVPMTRSDSDNSKDRKGINVETVENNAV
jgi:hypothetical protein